MSMPITQGLELTVKTLDSVVTSIRNNVLRSEGAIDKKAIGAVARLVELLEKTASTLEALSKKLVEVKGDFVEISPFFYLFKAGNNIVLLRTKPEHIALSFNLDSKTISIKTRQGELSVSQSGLIVKARGIAFEITPFTPEGFNARKDELRILLGIFEKSVYKRLIPNVEQKALKR